MVDFPHKIQVPQRPAHLVSRARLIELLAKIQERRLITLSAPAGYGKTSLLIDFASANPPFPVCWYTLDNADQDPWEFLQYVAASIDHRFPHSMSQTAALLAGRGHSPFAAAATALLREVAAIEHDFVLVIDDWHLVDHVPDIGHVIAQLLHRTPNCHVILASRIYPSLPDIMLLAARRQLIGLDEDPLRFTPAEAAAVLGADSLATISLEQAEALVERSAGWITGILLALQTAHPVAPATPGALADQQIYWFLAEQVFDQLSPEVQEFLLDASLLDELTPERCDALFERTTSGRLLEMLLRQRLFITEITPGVLRLHPLFREFLQKQYRTVDPARYRAMTLRVARVYADQRQWALAFDTCILAGDLEAAQQIVAAGGEQLYTSGRLETLERWFAALPQDSLDAPLLCLKARVLLDRKNYREAQVLADLAEARARPEQGPQVKLVQANLARIAGDYERAMAMAQGVLALVQDDALRATALRTLGICYHRLNQVDRAIDAFNEALAVERRRGDVYATALLQDDLAGCYGEMGQLHEAEEYYSYADAYWASIGNAGRRALTLNNKGVAQQLAGRYLDAHATLMTALRYARDAAISNHHAPVQASLGDLYVDLQLWARAETAYKAARGIGGSAYLAGYLDLAGVRLLVCQGRYEAAERALGRLPPGSLEQHRAAALLLRARIASGLRRNDEASETIRAAIALLEQANMPMDLARAYVAQAQIASSSPAANAAFVESLARAAAIADQIGHDAFLVAETFHVPNLLRRAQAAGWARAATWLARHQEIRLAAQLIEQEGRPVLGVRALGADQITLNGRPVEIGWLKAREVLYYLLANPNGAAMEALCEAIWPELSPERARNALKTAVSDLRSVLPRDLIELHNRQVYRLNREAAWIDYDVEIFLQRIERCADDPEVLFEALDLYQGPFLQWSENQWSSPLRTHLEQRYLQALRRTADRFWHDAAYLDALAVYQRILAVDALDEAAHAGVMRCQLALGNRAAAISQYRALRRTLDEELGLELEQSSEAEQLYHRILAAT